MSKLNISRRDFLKAAGVSAAALGLTACGGSSSSTAASGSASAAGSTASAGGSNWPTDTVSFYVPAKAGGGTDMTARVFLQGINEVHPGNYIVVNDVTGGGTVAAENVRNAKPDGLNLLAYHTGLCTSIASGQYAHDLSEFTICGMFITVPDEATGGLFVPGNSKFDKLEDLIAYGKEHPGDLKCLVAWGGKGCKRSSIIPDTPTLEEIYPDENMPRLDMYGYIAGPAGMSDELVQTINDAIKEAVETDTVKEGYKKLATTVEWVSPADSVEILQQCQNAYNEAYALTQG